MKILAVGLAMLASACSFAQNIQIEKDRVIRSKAVSEIAMDLGMGQEMKVNTESASSLLITGSDDTSFTATITVNRIKMKQSSAMGDNNFDSDSKADRESEIGQMVSGNVDKPMAISINKNTGIVFERNPERESEDAESDPMSKMMGSFGGNGTSAGAGEGFFVIPAGKKQGDRWVDSASTSGLKTLTNYFWKSTEGGMANLITDSKMTGTMQQEAQGMSLDMDMDNTMHSDILIDQKTSLVKKKIISSEMTGNVNMAGQSLPVSSKTATTITFE